MFTHRLSISFLGQLRAHNLCARHQRGGACSTDEQGHLSLCAARVPVVVVTNDTWFSIWTATRGSVLQQSLWFEVSISIIFYLLSTALIQSLVAGLEAPANSLTCWVQPVSRGLVPLSHASTNWRGQMHARTHAFTGRQTDIHANTHEKEIVARYKTHTDCDEPLRLDALCQRERASQTLLPLGAGPCGKIERFKGSKGR